MSLFDHIKKKPDANEEPKKNEPVANNDPAVQIQLIRTMK